MLLVYLLFKLLGSGDRKKQKQKKTNTFVT